MTPLQFDQTLNGETLYSFRDQPCYSPLLYDSKSLQLLDPYSSSLVTAAITTTSLYNEPHHVINKFMHTDIVQPTSPIPSIASRPLSSLSTLCSTLRQEDDDFDWKKKFQRLTSDLVVLFHGELETMSLELLKIEVRVRELLSLEKSLTEQYEQQEQVYLEKLEECRDVYHQQAKLIQQLAHLDLDLYTTTMDLSMHDKVELLRLKAGLFMGGSVGTGHVVHSFESPTHDLEYIIAGSGTTIVQHIRFQKHQYMLHIDKHDRKTKFKLLPKDLWMSDNQVDHCQFGLCSSQFTFFNRRHHCRRCGILVCQKHSLNRLPLFSSSKDPAKHWYRICDGCFYDIIIITKKPPAAADSATNLCTY